jgi:hypothetical protein
VATIDSGAAEGAGVGEGDALTDAFAEALAAGAVLPDPVAVELDPQAARRSAAAKAVG